jgi:magnesium-protoporphyrin IX monomethyl ester (oxidative) cyclase
MEYVENKPSNIEVLWKETPIFPEFYTTNIKKLSSTDTSNLQGGFSTAVANLNNDYTKDKYVRDERFDQCWDPEGVTSTPVTFSHTGFCTVG